MRRIYYKESLPDGREHVGYFGAGVSRSEAEEVMENLLRRGTITSYELWEVEEEGED